MKCEPQMAQITADKYEDVRAPVICPLHLRSSASSAVFPLRTAVFDLPSVFPRCISGRGSLAEISFAFLQESTGSFLEIRGAEAFAELLDLAVHAVDARFVTSVHRIDGGG